MKFWLEMGVDGFRLDAVPYLVEREGTTCENLPETHDDPEGPAATSWTNSFPAGCCWRRPTSGLRIFVLISANGDEFHMAFHFPLMPRMFMG